MEQGWNDLRIPGTVVPWQLFPIGSTRAQSGHRALAYPTYIMVSHDDFATFEQRPHGLMEVVVPGDSWLFGTVLPWRGNWPIIREFIVQWCPLGMLVDRLEIMLSGVHLTEQLVECWHGFYARIIITYGGSPSPGLLPFRQLWAPIPHLHHAMMGSTIRKHTVYIPGGTALLFSSTFEALGKENHWLPGAIQASVLLLRPIAFRLLRVNEAIRGELPVCPVDSIHYALIPVRSHFGSSFGSCWGGVHQFCLSMDNILRNLESLSRTELVWLNTYLVGRLRALPPENDSHPAVPGVESPGSVAMQGPNGVTSQQEAAIAPLPDRIDALNSSLDPWERTGAAPQGWATHLSGLYPIEIANRGGPFLHSALLVSLLLVTRSSLTQVGNLLPDVLGRLPPR